jgi:hypothetical protein
MLRAKRRRIAAAEYALLLRADFSVFAQRAFHELYPRTPFQMNWHLELIAARLAAVEDGRIRRLLINLPPRHLKSLLASIRVATSVSGILTGRGADLVVIDDPLKPEEALSDTRRKSANEWYDHTLYSRLNDKANSAVVVVMHRLHEDDLAGHVLAQEDWEVVRFPAIAETDETHLVETVAGKRRFARRRGEALHPEREPLDRLEQIRRTIGEYNYAGQYQQAPA